MKSIVVFLLFCVDLILCEEKKNGTADVTSSVKKSRWPCMSGCGMNYYGLNGGGLGGYSPYLSGLGGLGGMGMGMNPMMGGGCVDLSPQCATYVATGQCATNPFLIRRLCPISCGDQLGLGMGAPGVMGGMGGMGYNPMMSGMYGMNNGLYGGYGSGLMNGGYGGMYNPMMGGLGRSIYETGIYRSKPGAAPSLPLKTSISALSEKLNALPKRRFY